MKITLINTTFQPNDSIGGPQSNIFHFDGNEPIKNLANKLEPVPNGESHISNITIIMYLKDGK